MRRSKYHLKYTECIVEKNLVRCVKRKMFGILTLDYSCTITEDGNLEVSSNHDRRKRMF